MQITNQPCAHNLGFRLYLTPPSERAVWCCGCHRLFLESRGAIEELSNHDFIVRFSRAIMRQGECAHLELRLFRYTGEVRCYNCTAICGHIRINPNDGRILFIDSCDPVLPGLPG